MFILFLWCLFSFCRSLLLLSLLLLCLGCDEISHPRDFRALGIPTHASWSRFSVFSFLMPAGIFHICLVSNVWQLLSFYQNIRNVRAPDKVPQWIVIGLHPGKLPNRNIVCLVQQGAGLQAQPGLTWFEGHSTESSAGWKVSTKGRQLGGCICKRSRTDDSGCLVWARFVCSRCLLRADSSKDSLSLDVPWKQTAWALCESHSDCHITLNDK